MASRRGDRHSKQAALERKLDDSGAPEALVLAYDHATMQAIVDTVKWRPDAARNQIVEHIAAAALCFQVMGSERVGQAPTSTRERRLKVMLTKLQAAAQAIRNIESVDLAILEAAGSDLAELEGGLPDVPAIQISDPGIRDEIEPGVIKVWNASRQITASLERLNWLIHCIERALERLRREKASHGGNRPDEALHELIKDLDGLYF